ncbi:MULTISPECIES: type VI secretion system baseplate subunit TssG [Stenotrophomonas]|uniref:type VI secretion system baseplate subunit TssG n=1 Tax=Stenotrophomonas TaxID=40323 RepID=UPI000DB2F62E|nr:MULTISPECIES: type VI secretion system baseplate subunit TssG [Stenotrophomonas]MBA0429351.1 type VI secretion system baseplate subunit TssG [Stenotrophomonas maltophilia]MDH0273891.1 type VI secretion system baseplate subunit TssG [Stenotrophomonas sp. GD04089]MDH1910024.1 type VI secretion system baseplate subunit TssG [Stenotrophomonas sp. GD03794]PZP82108.1 MAG: type VI secretion system baseplate subunit TssG [Stenotrophomonas maltophilia]
MDGQTGRAAGAVDVRAALLQALAAAPHAFEAFTALRLLERTHPHLPRWGCSTRPEEDPLRLRQAPSLAFAPRDVDAVVPATRTCPPQLRMFGFGLFGPNGPLPLHLTEYALQRQRSARDDSLVAFADLFHHRLMSVFYRAWADAQPVVQADRPEDDRFRLYLGALVGIASPALQRRDALDDDFRRHHAGHLLPMARNAGGLRALTEAALQVPAQVIGFIAEWMRLPEDAQLHLGVRSNRLGHSAVLGAQVRGCQHRFRLRIGPLDLASFRHWLPGGTQLPRLAALIRSHSGDTQAWDVQLLLRADQVPTLRLARSGRLGLDTWLGRRAWSVADADDVVVHPRAAMAFTDRPGPLP